MVTEAMARTRPTLAELALGALGSEAGEEEDEGGDGAEAEADKAAGLVVSTGVGPHATELISGDPEGLGRPAA